MRVAVKHTARAEPESTPRAPAHGDSAGNHAAKKTRYAHRMPIRTLNGHTWSGRIYQGARVTRG